MGQLRIYTGDTAILQASVFAAEGFTPESPVDATWDFVDPDGDPIISSSLPSSPIAGDIVVLSADDAPFNAWDMVEYDGAVWNLIGQATASLSGNDASLALPGEVIQKRGLYRGAVRFIFPNNVRKSQPIDFEAIDALSPSGTTPQDEVIDHAWLKLEDCFDSELGGPWLRDKTLSIFDKDKMGRLLPDAIYYINTEYAPVTDFNATNWPYTTDSPLLSQALLVEAIYHLMRGYTEQPLPTGANIAWEDRRDYLSRWQTILQQEEAKLYKWMDLFKQQYLGMGQTAMLIGGYASSLLRAPKAMRTRLPRYYAGMYRRW